MMTQQIPDWWPRRRSTGKGFEPETGNCDVTCAPMSADLHLTLFSLEQFVNWCQEANAKSDTHITFGYCQILDYNN